ncbi:MAG TPA: response regulator transcription factor [Casimicrobiaceae bacterium]|nr:response regulator transcription factor [Casimicrobiaceae bacterium]
MRILIAEDDPTLADGLAASLRECGHSVDCVATGEEADGAISMFEFDLLILDLGLPRMSGLDVLKRLRERNQELPVLILTAQDGVDDRVRGLDLGADDYLAKPFALEELKARVRALARRGPAGKPAPVEFGRLAFDPVGRMARVDGEVLELSARELALLELLLQRVDRTVSKTQLLDHMCEWGEEVSTNAIEVYVHRLRRKLESAGVEIVTLRGIGYRIRETTVP